MADVAPATAPAEHSWFSQAALDVTAERRRQIEVEGWTPEHDDQHKLGEISLAAGAYAIGQRTLEGCCILGHRAHALIWPWETQWWKPKDRRSNLVRAGALILAEIERMDREAAMTEAA